MPQAASQVASQAASIDEPLRIGVSSCLLGQEVRFDGQHKRSAFLTEELAPFVSFVPICPEVEVGMGIPREPVRLVRGADAKPLMLATKTGADWTARMNALAARRADELAREGLVGYVLKSKSPSCGMARVKLYDAPETTRAPKPEGVGLFARALMDRLPNLPVEEEGRLEDARLRENFVERIFAYARVRRLFASRWTIGDVVAFHTAHKMQLLAHSTDGYRALGALVGGAKALPRAELRDRYEAAFMAVLAKLATPGRHANVLTHMLGHLKRTPDDGDKRELMTVVEDHRRGLVPLVVPVTLMRHHARRLSVAYLLDQTYLEPHPKELMLRNHV
ncbi:MAG TPA: DUF523 and DUF1722 domain-containing protein [Polyangia bacterium]|nr:DUF523 and DUF1722 domain-containing protein [Polyangia bacterium]